MKEYINLIRNEILLETILKWDFWEMGIFEIRNSQIHNNFFKN